MGDRTKIEWTDATWNPATGCDPISAGCENCYARRMASRFGGADAFHPTEHWGRLDTPHGWRKPRRVFVCSMGDLFHEDISTCFVKSVFQVMNENRRHTFQVLTKRPLRAQILAPQLDWTPNIWMGVTVEDANNTYRLNVLRALPARVRFVSFEPLIGPINTNTLDLSGIHWVICGGENGPKARPMKAEWARDLRRKCVREGIPFFLKGWGMGLGKDGFMDGRAWRQFPKEV